MTVRALPLHPGIEAMSQDLGNVPAGFGHNFAYGTLNLGGNDVQLVDDAHNSAGTGSEALYVGSLIVPYGATLDLNGHHLYVRTAQVNGTIIGGTVNRLASGGPLLFATPTSGTVEAASEVDDWTIFGRANESIVVIVSTGSGGNPEPVPPTLDFALVQVLGSSGTVLATVSNGESGTDAKILGLVLPADGTYHVKVQADARSRLQHRQLRPGGL